MTADVILGTTRRNNPFTWYARDRSTHMQVLGASGRGKSKLLEDMIRQDISNLQKPGLLLLDPHGSLYNAVLNWCAWVGGQKTRNIHLFNPSQDGWAPAFNPLRPDEHLEPSVRVDAMVQACAQVWGGEDPSQTPLLKKCLRAVFYSLSKKGYTLLEATELVSAADPFHIRQFLTSDLGDRVFQSIWNDFNSLAGNFQTRRLFVEQFSSTNNRMLEFLSAPTVRTIIGQNTNTLDLRTCIEEGEIILVNLAPSPKLSIDNARLLGTLLINDILVTALGRDPATATERPFYVYIDECYDYLTNDVEKMLDQTRKFGVHLILCHQRLGQLRDAGDGVYNAVMTGAQTKVVFGGLTSPDAHEIAADIFLAELDLEKGIEATKNPMVVAQKIEWLEGEIESDTEAAGKAEATSSDISEGTIISDDAESLSEGMRDGSGTTIISTASHTSGRSRQEALASVFEDRYSGVHSLENEMHKAAVRLVNQPRRMAIVKVPGHHSAQITVQSIDESPISEHRYEEYVATLLERSPYTSPLARAEEAISVRYEELKQLAQEAARAEEPKHYDSRKR